MAEDGGDRGKFVQATDLGTVVADDLTDLTDGTLDNAVLRTAARALRRDVDQVPEFGQQAANRRRRARRR